MSRREKLLIADNDGVEHEIPSMFVICDRCEGHGTHDHPAFANGFTGSEMEEADPEEFQDYMDGKYDVTCTECKGKRMSLIPDERRLSDEQRSIVNANEEKKAEKRDYERLCELERRMGC